MLHESVGDGAGTKMVQTHKPGDAKINLQKILDTTTIISHMICCLDRPPNHSECFAEETLHLDRGKLSQVSGNVTTEQ